MIAVPAVINRETNSVYTPVKIIRDFLFNAHHRKQENVGKALGISRSVRYQN